MLCDLPNEVIAIIASFCQPADLCALSWSCKLLYSHASPALYRHIIVKNGTAEYIMCDLGRVMFETDDGERHPLEESRLRELLRQTRSLDISLHWYEPDFWQTRRIIDVINDMVNLRHMSLIYIEEEEYMNGHDLPLPSVLAETLKDASAGQYVNNAAAIKSASVRHKNPTSSLSRLLPVGVRKRTRSPQLLGEG